NMTIVELVFSRPVDCSRCLAWCCQVYQFEQAGGFGETKRAGHPCRHLTSRGRCGVYGSRAEHVYGACVGYTCHGAGSRLTRLGREGNFSSQDDAHRAHFALRRLCEYGWAVERVLVAMGDIAAHPASERRRVRDPPWARTWSFGFAADAPVRNRIYGAKAHLPQCRATPSGHHTPRRLAELAPARGAHVLAVAHISRVFETG